MEGLRIAAIFLSLSAATVSCCSCSDMRIHRITTRGSTSVSCPNVTGSEVKFHLLRSNSEIGVASVKQNDITVESPFQFQEQNSNRTAHFILSQLNVNGTGIYSCDVQMLYPPPYQKLLGTLNMVIVQEVQQVMVRSPETPPKVWIWVVLAVIAAYSLVITGIAAGLWHNLKNKQTLQHDYMNMKPRAMRKKQGVQHPVRLGKY